MNRTQEAWRLTASQVMCRNVAVLLLARSCDFGARKIVELLAEAQ